MLTFLTVDNAQRIGVTDMGITKIYLFLKLVVEMTKNSPWSFGKVLFLIVSYDQTLNYRPLGVLTVNNLSRIVTMHWATWCERAQFYYIYFPDNSFLQNVFSGLPITVSLLFIIITVLAPLSNANVELFSVALTNHVGHVQSHKTRSYDVF